MTTEELNNQKNALYTEKQNLEAALSAGDYKVIKCAEDRARGIAKANLPYDIDALHEERQHMRDRINEIENAIAAIDEEMADISRTESERSSES